MEGLLGYLIWNEGLKKPTLTRFSGKAVDQVTFHNGPTKAYNAIKAPTCGGVAWLPVSPPFRASAAVGR